MAVIKLRDLPPDVARKLGLAPARRSKYGNVETAYRGVRYDSKREAQYAVELDMLQLNGDVRLWVDHPRFVLTDGFAYRADFLVIYRNGDVEAVDVKGAATQRFRDACRLWAAHGRIPLRIVRRGHPDEIIPPRD